MKKSLTKASCKRAAEEINVPVLVLHDTETILPMVVLHLAILKWHAGWKMN